MSLGYDMGLSGDRTGPLVIKDHIRMLPCQEGSCRRLLSGLGETRLPPEDLQPVCSRVPGMEGLCFGALVASWLGLPRESDWKPFTPDKNFFIEAPVCVPQAMFCTLQTRPHLSQTGLDLKAMRRGFAQDRAVSVFAPQFPPRQPCLCRPEAALPVDS